MDDAKHGWRTRVAPSLESGKDAVASFFGKVSDAVRESNDALQRRPDFRSGKEAFGKRVGEMGDVVSRRAATAMDTLKEGTRELRYGVADLMTRDPMTFESAFAEKRADEKDGDDRDATRSLTDDDRLNGASTSDFVHDPPDKGALLGIGLERRAAWDAALAPVPCLITATCQFICADETFLESRDFFAASSDDDSEDERFGRQKANALLVSFTANPAHIIGPEVPKRVAVRSLWTYLEKLPEPLVAFSLYAALAREGASDDDAQKTKNGETVNKSEDKVEALVGLLSPARRVALECVLGVAARVVVYSAEKESKNEEETEVFIAAIAAAVAPRVAWPRAGRWSPETTRRAFCRETTLDPSNASDRAAREARAIAACVARLVRRRADEISKTRRERERSGE
uniref:Rho-GAP domain-containing protein n=1 Tax=Micromonas pusilla TaxID=38833 RepID=A0A7S0DAI2_MICPS